MINMVGATLGVTPYRKSALPKLGSLGCPTQSSGGLVVVCVVGVAPGHGWGRSARRDDVVAFWVPVHIPLGLASVGDESRGPSWAYNVGKKDVAPDEQARRQYYGSNMKEPRHSDAWLALGH